MLGRLKDTGHHVAIFGIGGFLQQAAGFLLLPVYTRYLTPAEYGIVNLLLVGGSLLSSIIAAPIGAALFRSYYDYESESARSIVVSTALVLVTVGSSMLLLLGTVFSRYLSVLLTGDPQYAFLCILVLVTSSLQGVSSVTLAVFRAQKWSKKYVSLSLGTLAVSVTVTIYLVVARNFQIVGVIIGGLTGAAFSLSVSMWLIRHHLQRSISGHEIRKMIHYGLPLVPENLGGVAFNSADRLVIQAFLGPAAVGVYALGRRLGQIVQMLIIHPYSLAEAPAVLSAERDPDAKKFYARLLTYYLLATTFVSVGVAVLTPDVLRIVATPAFWGAAVIVPWISAASILYGMRNLIGIGLGLKRKTIWFPVALGTGAIVYGVLLILMVPAIGIVGAALALTISYGVMCLVRYIAGQQIYPMQFEVARALKLFAAMCATALLGHIITIEPVALSLFVKATLVVTTMPLILFSLRFADEHEIRYLKKLGLSIRRNVSLRAKWSWL